MCLFGKMAEVYDVSAGTTQNARNIFGIKGWQTKGSKYHKKEWSDEERENFSKDLGGDYDVNLARKYNCSVDYVLGQRRSLGIPSFKKNSCKVIRDCKKIYSDETKKEIMKKLGKQTDFLVAKEYGCDEAFVRRLRHNQNIKPFNKKNTLSNKCLDKLKKELGKSTDLELANKYGMSYSFVSSLRRKMNIKAFYNINDLTISQREKLENELGQYSDCFLAKKYNVAITKIRNIRIQLGILPFQKQKYFDEYESENMLKDLGKMPDREAAIKYGCSISTIFKLRKKNKIKSFVDTKNYIKEM